MTSPGATETSTNSPMDRAARGQQVFGILLGLYALILYPILRADRPYNDDLKRALSGRASWDSNGRPLTTLLMRALQCYDHAMVDISPLTQVGAVAVLALIGAMLARRHAIGPAWLAALVAFPLGAQPFFLENLSYKFDALSMCLAMLLALLPLLRRDHGRRDWWLGVLALFGSLNLYQPAINLYLVFMLLQLVLMQLDDAPARALAATAARRVVQVVTAMLIYQLLIGIHISGWVRHQAEPIHGWRELPLLWRNFADFYGLVGAAFNWHWWLYFAPLLLVLATLPVIVGVRHALRQRALQPRWVTLLLASASVAMPLAAMVCALGPMLLLRQPEMFPRVLMGFGALLCAGLVLMQAALRRWRRSERWAHAAGAMLALGMAVLASAYGNATTAQKVYEQHIAARLADDLAALPPVHALVVDGSAGYAPLARHVVDELPLMRSLVPIYLVGSDPFNTRNFLMYYVPELVDPLQPRISKIWDRREALAAETCAMKPRAIAAAYRLYLVGDIAVVRLRANSAVVCGGAGS